MIAVKEANAFGVSVNQETESLRAHKEPSVLLTDLFPMSQSFRSGSHTFTYHDIVEFPISAVCVKTGKLPKACDYAQYSRAILS